MFASMGTVGTVWLWLAGLGLGLPILFGVVFYLMAALSMRHQEGSRVPLREFDLGDLFLGAGLVAFFVASGLRSMVRGERVPVDAMEVNAGSGMMVLFLAATLIFRMLRGMPVGVVFSGDGGGGGFGLILMRAALWLAAAFPVVWAVHLLSGVLIGGGSGEQGSVTLLRNAIGARDWPLISAMSFSTVLVAPVAEEVIFRGIFYPALRRYSSGVVAAIFTSLAFGLSHAPVQVSPGLAVLSGCLIIAYERSGTLWVPIVMHAVFNGTSMLCLYADTQGWLTR